MNIERSPLTADAASMVLSDAGDAFSANRKTPGRVQELPPAAVPGPAPCLVQDANNKAAASAAQHLFMPALFGARARFPRGQLYGVGVMVFWPSAKR